MLDGLIIVWEMFLDRQRIVSPMTRWELTLDGSLINGSAILSLPDQLTLTSLTVSM